eukprot:SM000010S04197  [mRNA]  locus=s10:92744:92986:- [translate_table: standard]
MHRVTSRVVAVATTSARDLRASLPALADAAAARTVGALLAERAKAADVYAVAFELRRGDKYEGPLAAVVDALVENGIALI